MSKHCGRCVVCLFLRWVREVPGWLWCGLEDRPEPPAPTGPAHPDSCECDTCKLNRFVLGALPRNPPGFVADRVIPPQQPQEAQEAENSVHQESSPISNVEGPESFRYYTRRHDRD